MLRFQQGDGAAFDRLYVLLKGPLYTFLYRFSHDEQLSMDLVQDAFLMLERNKQSYQPEKGRVKSYLLQIGYRLMINKLNRRRKWRSLLPFLAPAAEPAPSPEDRLTIREALLQLSEEQRAVILLAYYHDLPQKEIADILSIPLGTVKSRLHHGLKQLKLILEVEDLDTRSFSEGT
ncbi:RNA polymerase sigma factor [Ectobacillus sp. SYSU M60031]|uniref:RNA polymerase sigma factor n=1 Tax=Ectobacillus ponti TaxID=2961894 RepID=A0AA42BQ73_9BACI|nr:RNA polymerase sigma factor [Ectobacillus ponti]MCP8968139.1 RNA polymerase sigma factor [Ectobacillus ponti]